MRPIFKENRFDSLTKANIPLVIITHAARYITVGTGKFLFSLFMTIPITVAFAHL